MTDPVEARRSATGTYHHAIDGLRAVAVLLVVAYHAGVPGFSNGYLGVDMFFAISGFLITRQLVTDTSTGETRQLRDFWAARARRIIPAVAVTIIATCVASAAILAPQELRSVGILGLASNFFALNIFAPLRGGDYFAGPLRDSPFLHMWSLGAEEQFYVVWPLLLGPMTLVLVRVSTRLRRQLTPARAVLVMILAVSVVSFAIQLRLSASHPLWAFYGLPGRMYQFSLAGAASLFLVTRIAPRWRNPLAAMGVALVVLAVAPLNLDPWGPVRELLTSSGTIAVMLGTARSSALGPGTRPAIQQVLESAPMALLGRYSFSWYLWHWPAYVLALAATDDDRLVAGVACVASLLPGIAAFHLVEQRVRYAGRLTGSWRASLAMGAALILTSAVACGGVLLWGRIHVRDPQIARWIAAEESYVTAGCEWDSERFGVQVCLGGSTEASAPVVLLAGDSHASQWAAAYSEAGARDGYTVVVHASTSCPAAGPRTDDDRRSAADERCREHQEQTRRMIASEDLDAIIAVDAVGSRTPDVERWYREMAALADLAEQNNLPMGSMVDNPYPGEVLRCLSRGDPESRCRRSLAAATERHAPYEPASRRLERDHGVGQLDLTLAACPTDPCPVEVHGVIVPARAGHLNRDFTLTQTGRLSDFVHMLLERADPLE